MSDLRRRIRDALDALGIRRFVLGIHDAAFPSAPDEDAGRGTPHGAGAEELLELASALGFDGLQLGPQGATSAVNASPYDATLFSRDPLSIALGPLTRPEWGALLSADELERAVAGRPPGDRVSHAYAHEAIPRALDAAVARFRSLRANGEASGLAARLAAFRAEHASWLVPDALYEVLRREHGGAGWQRWPARDRELSLEADRARREDLLARHGAEVESYALVQLLAHEQHRAFRARARALGLALFGDLQVGMSDRDAWATQRFVLRDWRMGAPPSRTNPAGQAWNFPVLDPRRYREDGGDGPALRFVRARARKVLAEVDGLRIDHPHGLVCPWVYRVGPSAPDPEVAVRSGARLFDSPGLPDLPELAAFAIARADQLDRGAARDADGWVRSLDPEQVERYAVLFDAVVAAAPEPRDVACEILSTQPHPLARVIERHRLGRFRITQKADLASPGDVYRGDAARPEDWIMLGNHDTRPIWRVTEHWIATGAGPRSAEYLAARLVPRAEDRAAWARALASDAPRLAQAAFAELFVGPARHVHVYFTDLLGSRERYNAPGTVTDENWSLRVPHRFRAAYAARAAAGLALDVPRALATALRARGERLLPAHRALAEALDRSAVP